MRNTKILVSLTSFPKRIHYVDTVIKTILIQTMKPDKVILWLAESEFPNKVKDLPDKLLQLCDYGLEIRWCQDIKSHKKYLYAMKDYPEYCVITVDDDTYYFPDTLEVLYKSFLRHPLAVSCLRANKITFNYENRINPYSEWVLNEKGYVDIPLMDLMAVGNGGILYPPGCIEKQFLDENRIKEICLYQDDIWLKCAQIHSGIEVVLAESGYATPKAIKEEAEYSLCRTVNISGNDIAIKNVGAFYDKLHGSSDFIARTILASDHTCMKKVEQKRNETNRLADQMRNSEIVVYGAGKDAQVVYDCLSCLNFELKIQCFAVTDKKGNPDHLYNIPVLEISDVKVKESTIVIVAMDECWHDEIASKLKMMQPCKVLYISNEQMGLYFRGKKLLNNSIEDFLFSLRS